MKNKMFFTFFMVLLLAPLSVFASSTFSISAWVPYWAKTDGSASAISHISLLDEVHPFSYEVQADGSIKDTMKLSSSPYKELLDKAREKNVKIIPTFLWTGPKAMHNVFTNEASTTKHINDIIALAQAVNASGVDIDYEGKKMEDKTLYASFFKKLSVALHAKNLTLSCTIEAASTASPSAALKKLQATSPWSNDLASLNKSCDVIRLMAYDQMPQTTTSTWTDNTDKVPYAPNADITWVRKVLNYNLKFIDKKKLVLGIPTYGWDTKYTKSKKGGYDYDIMKSVPFEDGLQLARDNNVVPKRDATGGLNFTYVKNGANRIVYLSDANSVQYAYEAAKKAGIRGVTLFKVDGKEDPNLWNVLAK